MRPSRSVTLPGPKGTIRVMGFAGYAAACAFAAMGRIAMAAAASAAAAKRNLGVTDVIGPVPIVIIDADRWCSPALKRWRQSKVCGLRCLIQIGISIKSFLGHKTP